MTMLRWGRRTLLFLVGLAGSGSAGGGEGGARSTNYLEQVAVPNIRAQLDTFMRFPFETISFSLPMADMGFLDLDSGEEVREWLYNQIVATGQAAAHGAMGGNITMLYVGKEDGVFVGFHTGNLVYRSRSASAASFSWAPFTMDSAPSSVEGVPRIAAVSCGGPAAASGWTEAERAGCRRLVSRPPSSHPAAQACCSSNIRGHYSFSREQARRRLPIASLALTHYDIYDARVRPWYVQAKERWLRSREPTGWSSVYTCRSLVSGQAGRRCITATGSTVGADGQLRAVFGADYNLEQLSELLAQGVRAVRGSWVYVVERGTDPARRGRLLATSTADPVYSAATDSGVQSVAQSARRLEALGWPEAASLNDTKTSPGRGGGAVGWECHAETYRGTHGLDWLLVTGQDMNCTANQVWSFGLCRTCEVGKSPSGEGQCAKCPSPHEVPRVDGLCASCPGGFEVDAQQTRCRRCTEGKVSSADSECHHCPARYQPNGARTTCTCAPGYYNATQGQLFCHEMDWSEKHEETAPSLREECLLCPPCADCSGPAAPWLKDGWRAVPSGGAPTTAVKRRGARQDAFHCAIRDACPRQVQLASDPSRNVANGTPQGQQVCAEGHGGTLCGTCMPGYHMSALRCNQCDSTLWHRILHRLGFVAVVLLLFWILKHWQLISRCVRHTEGGTEQGGALTTTFSNPVAGSPSLTSMRDLTSQLTARASEKLISLQDFDASAMKDFANVVLRASFTPVRTLITYWQVVAQIGRVLHVDMPGSMSGLVDVVRPMLSVWDVLFSMECAGLGGFTYKWISRCVGLPLLAMTFVALIYLWESRRGEHGGKRVRMKSRILFAIFFVYPTICNVAFAAFNCRDISAESSILVDDDRLFCQTARVRVLQTASGAVVVIFAFGVPIGAAIVLVSKAWEFERDSQDPKAKELADRVGRALGVDSSSARFVIQDLTKSQDVSFLLNSYKPHYHYWEVLDMLRKLTLVGLVLFVGRGSTAQVALAITFSFLFFAWHVATWPFKVDSDNRLRTATEIHIFFCFTVCLVLKTELAGEQVGKDFYGWLLFVSFIVLVPFAFVVTVLAKIALARSLVENERSSHKTDGAQAVLQSSALGAGPANSELPDAVTAASGSHSAFGRLSGAFRALVGVSDGTATGGHGGAIGTQRMRERLAFQRVVHDMATQEDPPLLMRLFEKIQTDIENDEQTRELSDAEKQSLVWVREDLGHAEDSSDLQAIKAAAETLDLQFKQEDDVHVKVRRIRKELVQLGHSYENQDGVFLSHYQVYGPDVMELKSELERTCPALRGKIWYDKDRDPSPEEMRLGVKNSRVFLLYLTEGVLERWFCRKEIRWALLYEKTVVLLWKQEGKGAVHSFANFFTDCGKTVNDDDGAGLTEILNTAAVPYYLIGSFHAASMSELLRKLGHSCEVAGASPMQYEFVEAEPGEVMEAAEDDFSATGPTVLLGFCAANGAPQMGYIARELLTLAPSICRVMELKGDARQTRLRSQSSATSSTSSSDLRSSYRLSRMSSLDAEPAPLSTLPLSGAVLLVYLTEGLFDDDVFVQSLAVLLQRRQLESDGSSRGEGGEASLPIIWIAETDMRHGWSQHASERPNDNWRDALECMKQHPKVQHLCSSELLPADVFEGALVPFYKDKCFRDVSLREILREMGAFPVAGASGSASDGAALVRMQTPRARARAASQASAAVSHAPQPEPEHTAAGVLAQCDVGRYAEALETDPDSDVL